MVLGIRNTVQRASARIPKGTVTMRLAAALAAAWRQKIAFYRVSEAKPTTYTEPVPDHEQSLGPGDPNNVGQQQR